jgi:ABC-2 type transport system ATP-binding protein
MRRASAGVERAGRAISEKRLRRRPIEGGMIQVENLTKRYGTFEAVRGVSFGVERGEVVGFLGPNGAGKTTTMRILCGCIGATSGRALVDGKDVLEEPRAVKRKIGYLPEIPPLYTSMVVGDYVAFAARIKGVADPEAAARTAMGKVGLDDVAHRLIDHLSKGYRQRVGLAQALVHDPEVLVLDEPTSGLDPAQRVEIRELLQALAAGERTVILSTHVLSEVEAVCDRVVIINQGAVVAQDTIEALASSGRRIRLKVARAAPELGERLRALAGVRAVDALEDGVYVLETDADVRARAAETAVPFGLLELRMDRGLEEVYLRLARGEAA